MSSLFEKNIPETIDECQKKLYNDKVKSIKLKGILRIERVIYMGVNRFLFFPEKIN